MPQPAAFKGSDDDGRQRLGLVKAPVILTELDAGRDVSRVRIKHALTEIEAALGPDGLPGAATASGESSRRVGRPTKRPSAHHCKPRK